MRMPVKSRAPLKTSCCAMLSLAAPPASRFVCITSCPKLMCYSSCLQNNSATSHSASKAAKNQAHLILSRQLSRAQKSSRLSFYRLHNSTCRKAYTLHRHISSPSLNPLSEAGTYKLPLMTLYACATQRLPEQGLG